MNAADQTVLVTGGAGFVGSHLTTRLVEHGYNVRVLDNLATGHRSNLAHLDGRFTFIEGSITDLATCMDAAAGAMYVWHLAALGSVPRSLANPMASNEANVGGTLNVLWAAKEQGARRVVFSSSSSVYGKEASLPQRPGDPLAPSSPYAVSKMAGEKYLKVFYECYGLETVVLRFFNVFGPRQNPDNAYAAVIPKFVAAILRGQVPVIEGDGRQSRDFTYIKDCVQGTVKAMLAPDAPGRVFNVACERQTTVAQLYDTIRLLLGSEVRAEHGQPRVGDLLHSRADISETRSILGYEPEYTVQSGLEEAIGWYRDYLEAAVNS